MYADTGEEYPSKTSFLGRKESYDRLHNQTLCYAIQELNTSM